MDQITNLRDESLPRRRSASRLNLVTGIQQQIRLQQNWREINNTHTHKNLRVQISPRTQNCSRWRNQDVTLT